MPHKAAFNSQEQPVQAQIQTWKGMGFDLMGASKTCRSCRLVGAKDQENASVCWADDVAQVNGGQYDGMGPAAYR
jgi:hypothetical protein